MRLDERFPQLWAFLDRLGIAVIGSLLFWLFSGLIITAPAALAALFAAVAPLVRPASGDTAGRFWRGFRRSLLSGTLLGLLTLLIGLSVYLGVRLSWALGTPFGKAAALLYGSLGATAAMVSAFAWPLLAWYPQPLAKLLKRAFLLTAAHPLHALSGLGGALLMVWLFLWLPGPLLGLLPATGPGLAAALIGYATWKAMKRYVGPDDDPAE